MAFDPEQFVRDFESTIRETNQRLMALQQTTTAIAEHNFQDLASKTKDEQEKKYYEAMNTLVTRLTGTGDNRLSRKQVLEHQETKKLMEEYQKQPAGLFLDNSGKCTGYGRSNTKVTNTNTTMSTKSKGFSLGGFSSSKSKTTTSDSSSSSSFSYEFRM